MTFDHAECEKTMKNATYNDLLASGIPSPTTFDKAEKPAHALYLKALSAYLKANNLKLPETVADAVNLTIKKWSKASPATTCRACFKAYEAAVQAAKNAVEPAKKPLQKPTPSNPGGTATAPEKPVEPAKKRGRPVKDAAVKEVVATPAEKPAAPKKLKKVAATSKPVKAKEVIFPETLAVSGIGDLTLVPEMSFGEFKKLAESDVPLFVALRFNGIEIKKYNYAGGAGVDCPAKFPDDIDVLSPVFFGDKYARVLLASVYTEGVFRFDASDFGKFGNLPSGELVRSVSSQIFQIYRKVDKVVKKSKR